MLDFIKEVKRMQTLTELQELIYLRQKTTELELKLQLLEKAVEFLAERIDEERKEKNKNPNTHYLVNHILQK